MADDLAGWEDLHKDRSAALLDLSAALVVAMAAADNLCNCDYFPRAKPILDHALNEMRTKLEVMLNGR
jgi:hypothetical protein